MTDQNRVPQGAESVDLSELAVAATMSHELFTSYVNAGFAEHQALYLIGQLLIGTRPRLEQ